MPDVFEPGPESAAPHERVRRNKEAHAEVVRRATIRKMAGKS
ncbi:MAG: hypothetical protein AAF791_02875 [Bacteroidota bacterium]